MSPGLRRAVHLWGPAVAMMALLFIASSLPGSSPVLRTGFGGLPAHLVAYGLLGALVLRALAGARWRGVTAGRAARAVLICGLYGLSDEFHQRFVPGRTPDVLDLYADVGGAACGAVLVWACGIVLSSRHPEPGERRQSDG